MNEKKEKSCCQCVHPMYEDLTCEKEEGHDGLHCAYYEQYNLKWGVPSQEERYNVIRTK